MNVLLDNKEVYPYIERSILVDKNSVTIEYTIIGNLDMSIEYKKVYQSEEIALRSMREFSSAKSTLKCPQFKSESPLCNLLQMVVSENIDILRFDSAFVLQGDKKYLKRIYEKQISS